MGLRAESAAGRDGLGRARGDRSGRRAAAGHGDRHHRAACAGRRRARTDRRYGRRARALRGAAYRADHARAAGGARTVPGALRTRRRARGDRLVLPAVPRVRLHQGRPHRPQCAIRRGFARGAARDHDQPVKTREGPARHRGGAHGSAAFLSGLPAVRREPGLCRAAGLPRAPEPPDGAADASRRAIPPAILALPVLRRAQHRAQRHAPADDDRLQHLRAAARVRRPVPALLPGLERRPADRGRLDPVARPLPGRRAPVPDGCGGRAGCPPVPIRAFRPRSSTGR